MEPNSGIAPMSGYVCTVGCSPEVRNSDHLYMAILLVGDLSGLRITSVLSMSPRPSDRTRLSAAYTKASAQSLGVRAVQNGLFEKY